MHVNDMNQATLNWAVSKALGLKSLPPLSAFDNEKLPYDFDLLYDLKYWHEVKAVLDGEDHLHKSDASINDLIVLANDLGYSLEYNVNYCTFENVGPIIVENLLSPYFEDNAWRCQVGGANDLQCQGFVLIGPSYFESALKCFTAGKLGMEVEVSSPIIKNIMKLK